MRKTICIIDYNAGNIMSLYHTVSKISDYNVIISNKINEVEQADYLILPGVGSYSYVSKYLEEKKIHNIRFYDKFKKTDFGNLFRNANFI